MHARYKQILTVVSAICGNGTEKSFLEKSWEGPENALERCVALVQHTSRCVKECLWVLSTFAYKPQNTLDAKASSWRQRLPAKTKAYIMG